MLRFLRAISRYVDEEVEVAGVALDSFDVGGRAEAVVASCFGSLLREFIAFLAPRGLTAVRCDFWNSNSLEELLNTGGSLGVTFCGSRDCLGAGRCAIP